MEREIDNLCGLVQETPADQPEEDTVPKSRYESLLKNFDTLEKNHQNLVSRVSRLLRQ